MIQDRWQECDRLNDPIARLDCRTSKMNDSQHRLEREFRLLKRKVNAGLVVQTFAGLGGIASIVTAFHNLTAH